MRNQQLTTCTSPFKKFTILNQELANEFRDRLFRNKIIFTIPPNHPSTTFYCSHRLEDCISHFEAVMEENHA